MRSYKAVSKPPVPGVLVCETLFIYHFDTQCRMRRKFKAIIHLRIVNKNLNVQLTIIFDQRIIPRLAYRPCLVPIGSFRGVAQPGSATALGAVGREFESLHPDQFLKWSVRKLTGMHSLLFGHRQI